MTDPTAVQELRGLIDERVTAITSRDGGLLKARHHVDVLVFNVLAPLKLTGSAVVENQTHAWFEAYQDGPQYRVHDLRIDAERDLGYCSFIYHVSGTLTDGNHVSMAVRATLVCKRIDGQWLIIHDHESVPFDPETGMALTDLPS